MAISDTVTPIEAARALGPLIRECAEEIEQERRLPSRLVAAIANAGLFRLLVPRELGGDGAGPLTFLRLVEAISEVDGATGWCVMIGGGLGMFAGLLPETAAQEIYGSDPAAITAGTFRANGVATAVEGGYRVSGQWPMASGIPHCNWVVGGCRILDGDQPRAGPDGAPVTRLLFFPLGAVEVLDTWRSAGLRGTGSHDFRVSDVFVPAARSCSFREPPVHPGPLYALPPIAIFAAFIAAVPLGIARHAIDALAELAGVKKPTWSSNALREKAMAQARVGEAEALLRSGRAFLYETVAESWEVVMAGGRLSWQQKALLWLASTQATAAASQAVDLMFSTGGATSVYATSPLERCLRDIRTAAQHVCVTPTNYELAGQALLGFDMRASLFAIDDRSDVS